MNEPRLSFIETVENEEDGMISHRIAFLMPDTAEGRWTHEVLIGGGTTKDDDLVRLGRHFLAVDMKKAADLTASYILSEEEVSELRHNRVEPID